ncbi:hypothetical protein JSY36_17300 [Bacillus sp. H-16]|uniref:hypothetical protein n=1 Tax=Alteribacter salitolerans TaxID=2912333 RepID=UPI001962517C|nr:hypothetical protein [Alteribacter salitolerans]MBM7097493.1 hypothetical protein [Alteribacter salitolerans]
MGKRVFVLTILSLHVVLSGYAHLEQEVAGEERGAIESTLHITVEGGHAAALMEELPHLFDNYASYEVGITEEKGFTTVSLNNGLYENDMTAALSHYETEVAGYSSSKKNLPFYYVESVETNLILSEDIAVFLEEEGLVVESSIIVSYPGMKSDAHAEGDNHIWKSDTNNFQLEFTIEDNNLHLPVVGIISILAGAVGILKKKETVS